MESRVQSFGFKSLVSDSEGNTLHYIPKSLHNP